MTPEQAAVAFDIPGDLLGVEPFGSGHIHDTYRMCWSSDGVATEYILQRVNLSIFTDGNMLLENTHRVCTHLQHATSRVPGTDPSREALREVMTRHGSTGFQDQEDQLWRAFHFVPDSYTLQTCRTDEDAFQASRTFGQFVQRLSDLEPGKLAETIPHFHHTPQRVQALKAAMKENPVNRLKDVSKELDFVHEHRHLAGRLVDGLSSGALPLRITHNDTKLNNVLFDQHTDQGLCVIDLDTCMPGTVAYDVGDMVRTMATSSSEDSTDLHNVTFIPERFAAIKEGYGEQCSSFLTQPEMDSFIDGGRVMILTVGIRFLTDYLAGDIYFKTRHATHNLERCRNQFALLVDMEKQLGLAPNA